MEILNDWQKQRVLISDLSELELKALLAAEKKERCRETVVVAIHQRLARVRTERERDALKEYVAKRRAKEANGRAKRG